MPGTGAGNNTHLFGNRELGRGKRVFLQILDAPFQISLNNLYFSIPKLERSANIFWSFFWGYK